MIHSVLAKSVIYEHCVSVSTLKGIMNSQSLSSILPQSSCLTVRLNHLGLLEPRYRVWLTQADHVTVHLSQHMDNELWRERECVCVCLILKVDQWLLAPKVCVSMRA